MYLHSMHFELHQRVSMGSTSILNGLGFYGISAYSGWVHGVLGFRDESLGLVSFADGPFR